MKRLVPFFSVFILFLTVSCTTTPQRNDYMTADIDPIEAGTITAGLPAFLTNRLRQVEILVTYHPRTDTVVFQFPYQLVTYRQHWNTVNRETLLAAISRYQSDFAAKSLSIMSRSKMRRAYGVLDSVTEWGTFKIMINSRARPKVELGYAFEQNSPYFVITQREAKNENASGDSGANTSLRVSLYFTRALAEDLAAALDRSRLLSLLPGGRAPESGSGEVAPDEY
ncbi:MAG: hypothetical protein LBB98_11555 [Treponema sp.]|nr:hypothetical protein [Treponema sp.]